MHLSPIPPVSSTTSYSSGDVLIDPTAIIGAGVLLQAEAHSRIVIAHGVCIGMGSIIHARSGTIEIGAGATLGAGVLAIGSVSIGANACVGAATTIFNCDLAPGQVVPPAVLLGDQSRQVSENSAAVAPNEPTSASEPASSSDVKVYGQDYLQRMMLTLLPHRRLS